MSDWINADKIDTAIHNSFIYRIDFLAEDGSVAKSYIGKKCLSSTRTKKLTLKEKAELPKKPGRQPSKKKVVSESDWKTYWSSSKELKDDVKKFGASRFRRTILMACPSKKSASYWETKLLFTHNVLESPELWYNANIGGTMYAKDTLESTLF